MSGKSKLLWMGEPDAPENLRIAAGDRWHIQIYRPDRPLGDQLRRTRLTVVQTNGRSGDLWLLSPLLDELDRTPSMAIFMLPREASEIRAMLARRNGRYIWVDEDVAAEELAAKLAAAEALQPRIRNLQLSASTRQTFEQMDEEMRLAARLQRDFLPRRLPEMGRSQFGVLYRPAGWLSGDIYDVTRLDETHVGFYVADAVGHGMPAALLTMFIKKALQTKRIIDHTYEIVPPHVSLQELNVAICEHNFSSYQFCTAVYAVFDTATSTLAYARAGHPEPVLIRADGSVEKLTCPGSLLGVFADEQYEPQHVQLKPGQRLIIYTDGADDVLQTPQAGSTEALQKAFTPWIGVEREEMLLQLAARIDNLSSASHIKDDITILVMDVHE